MKKKMILIIGLIIYLIIAFVSEIFYREPLYKKSIEYMKKMIQNKFLDYFNFFWSFPYLIIQMFCGILITFLFYPINIFFCNFSYELFLSFIMSIFKSLYSSPRPFWDIYIEKDKTGDKSKPIECDGGFGNPSGHSLQSTYALFLWYLFVNSNFFNKIKGKKKIVFKYLILIFAIISILFITYSRIYRQVHSFNQILFGSVLGISFFVLFCYIFEFDKINSHDFAIILDKYKFILIPILFLLFVVSIVLGLNKHNEKEDEYEKILVNYCGRSKEQLFGKSTSFSSTLVFAIIGGYVGMLFLKNKIDKYYNKDEDIFYNWNKRSILETIKISLFLLLSFIPLTAIFIPVNNIIIKIILASFSFLLYGFCLFYLCFYFACILFRKSREEINSLLSSEEEEEII